MADLATLGITVDANGAIRVTDQLGNSLKSTGEKAGGTEKAIRGLIAAFAAYRAAEWIRETVNLAARYETLGVVLDVVARNTGHTRSEMNAFQATLQKTGISMIESRSNLIKMAQAHVDLAQTSKLARVAQDAAVVANTNSSDAFARLVHGIESGNVLIMRNMGLIVNNEAAYAELALTLGKSADSLNQHEKVQARANAAIKAGTLIAGSYEAAMSTAGKQLNSTVRYMEDMRVKTGQAFLPAYTLLVFKYADALKMLGQNAPAVSAGVLAIAAAVVILTTAIKGMGVAASIASANPVVLALTGIVAALSAGLYKYAKARIEATAADQKAAVGIKEVNDRLRGLTNTQVTGYLAEIDKQMNAIRATAADGIMTPKMDADFKRLFEWRQRLVEFGGKKPGIPGKDVDAGAAKEFADAAGKMQMALDKQNALNAAHGRGVLALKYLEIAYDSMAERADAKAKYQGKELTTMLGLINAMEQAQMEAARVAHAESEAAAATKDHADAMDRIVSGMPAYLAGLAESERQLMELIGLGAKWKAKIGDDADMGVRGAVESMRPMLDAMAKAAEAKKQILENLIKGVQTAFADMFTDIFTKGLKSFGDLFDRIKQMFFRLIGEMLAARMVEKLVSVLGIGRKTAMDAAAAKQAVAAGTMNTAADKMVAAANSMATGVPVSGGPATGAGGAAAGGAGGAGAFGGMGWMKAGGAAVGGGLAGYAIGGALYDRALSDRQNRMRGGVGGAAGGAAVGFMVGGPIGAAIGGITGFVGGVLGAGAAAKKAAKEMRELKAAVTVSMASYRASITGDTLAAELAESAARLAAIRKQISEAYSGRDNERERNRLLVEANQLGAREVQNIRELNEQRKRYASEDLQVRLLHAQGRTAEAEALAFALEQQREMAAAVRANADAAYLASLEHVHAAERVARAMGTLQDAVRNAPTGFTIEAYGGGQRGPAGTDSYGVPYPGTPPPQPEPPPPPGTGGGGGGGGPRNGDQPMMMTVTIEEGAINIDGNRPPVEMARDLVRGVREYAAAVGGKDMTLASAMEMM